MKHTNMLTLNNKMITNNKTVVAICGYKETGKTEAGKILAFKHGFKEINFAGALKRQCSLAFNTPSVFFNKKKNEPLPKYPDLTGRKIMQEVSEKYKELAPRIWVDRWLSSLAASLSDKIVVTDLRFPIELEMIRQFDRNLIIKVVKDDVLYEDTHVSEKGFLDADVDVLIPNNSSVEELHRIVEKSYNEYINIHAK